jgi:serine/threonine protein kinase
MADEDPPGAPELLGSEVLLRAHQIFEKALDVESGERSEFVHKACVDEVEVEQQAIRLLAEFERAGEGSEPRPASELFDNAFPGSEFEGNSRFAIHGLLGSGAFGRVFKAWDREQRVFVALKVLSILQPDALFRFKREFRSLAQMRHPNLIRLYELFSEQDHWFFTMELIEGNSLLGSLRPLALANEWQSLRAAFNQLIAGVQYIHGSNQIHRDLKPSNVLVTGEGRVVILDFGLIQLVDSEPLGAATSIAGTVQYMSPEQLLGKRLTTESDWFSVGVMFFQILTDKLPYERSSLEIGVSQLTSSEALLASIDPAVPDDLRSVCVGLLAASPKCRINPIHLPLNCHSLPEQTVTLPHKGSDEPFIGREAEIRTLESAYTETREGKLNVVLVEGNSGIGKSALIQRFLEQLHHRSRDLIYLSGRCYEFESVPYKGVDSVIDELTSLLQSFSEEDIQSILPRDASLLPKLFPVLGRIRAIVNSPARSAIPDVQELRLRTFAALREMIARIADRHFVAIWIDDFQWADRDSSSFLAELCTPPNQPSMMLVISYRSEEVSNNPTLQYLRSTLKSNNRQVGSWHHVVLKGLSQEHSKRLASQLIGLEASDSTLENIASESGGNPLFVRELARLSEQTLTVGPTQGEEGVTLNSVLLSRIGSMSSSAKELLEILCIANQPLPIPIALAAVNFADGDRSIEELQTLIHENLARGCYEVCTKIGAYVGGRSYSEWKDGKQGKGRLSERCFG